MAKSRARKLADIIVGAGIDIDGNLTFDGGSTSADLTFADGDKANFGDASDLQIYHTGSSSVIRENGPGTFYIQGTDIVMTDSAGAERYADFTFDGASRLYHDNSVKFATTSTGIDVTGTITADGLTFGTNHRIQGTGGLFIGGSTATVFEVGAGSEEMRLTSTGLGIGTQSPGTSLHIANSSNSFLTLERTSPASGTGKFGINIEGTSQATFAYDNSSKIVIGRSSNPQTQAGFSNDFVFDSSGNFGIGTTAPAYKLQVNGSGIVARFTDGTSHMDLYSGSNLTEISTVNPLLFSVGSTERMRIDSSGNLIMTAGGTIRAGGVNDLILDAGESGTPDIYLQSGGSTKIKIEGSNGNVGIGTTFPSNTLHINAGNIVNPNSTGSEITSATLALGTNIHLEERQVNGAYSDRTDLAIVTNTGFGIGESEKIRIQASGNVGIGTTSPSRKLDVRGSVRFSVNTSTHETFTFSTQGVDEAKQIMKNASSVDTIILNTNGNTYFNGGNVGIGNTNPNLPLTITSNSGANGLALRARSNDDYSFIQFFNNAGSAVRGQIYNHNGNIGFTTGTDTSAGNDLYIKDGVGVGIGTTSPYGLTHWQDSSTINLIATNTGADGQADTTVMSLIGQARGYGNNIAKLANIDFKTDPNTWYRGVMTFNVAGYDGTDPSRTPIEAMRIDSAGNVGIGTGNTIRAPLQVHNSSTGAGSTEFRISRSVDSSAVNRKIAIIMGTDAANLGSTWKIESESSIGYNDSANLNFIHNAGGSPSTRVTFKANGNVGIGQTNPQGLLHASDSKGSAGNLWTQVGAGNAPSIHIQNTANVANTNAAIYFRNSVGEKASIGARFVNQSTGETHLRFSTTSSSGSTFERLVLDGDGNVGIGTLSPSTSLHIERTSGNATQLVNATANNTRATIETKAKTSGGVEIRGVLGSYGDATKVDIGTLSNHSLSILTNNTERMRIDSSGNVGIGVSSIPSWANLITNGTVAVGGILYMKDTQKIQGLSGFPGAASNLILNPDGGNVGIGTSSPQDRLHILAPINSGIRLQTPTANNSFGDENRIDFHMSNEVSQGTGNPAARIASYLQRNNNGYGIKFGVRFDSSTFNSAAMTLSAEGMLGIGTASPGEDLHIYRTSGNADAKLQAASAGDDSRLFISRNGSSSRAYVNYSDVVSGANWYTGLLRNTTNIFAIGQGDDFGTNTRLCIDNGGNVGIGTTNPSSKLEVNNPSGAGNGSAQEVARFVNTASGATSMYLYLGASTGTDWRVGKNVSGIANNTNFSIADNGGSRKLDLTPDGHLALGITDPSNPKHRKVEVTATTAVTSTAWSTNTGNNGGYDVKSDDSSTYSNYGSVTVAGVYNRHVAEWEMHGNMSANTWYPVATMSQLMAWQDQTGSSQISGFSMYFRIYAYDVGAGGPTYLSSAMTERIWVNGYTSNSTQEHRIHVGPWIGHAPNHSPTLYSTSQHYQLRIHHHLGSETYYAAQPVLEILVTSARTGLDGTGSKVLNIYGYVG